MPDLGGGVVSRWIAALVLALGAALAAAPVRADDEVEDPYEAGWKRTGYQRVRNVQAERPLTTPKRTFDVFVAARVMTPSPTADSFFRVPAAERDGPARLGLRYGALYGITADWEVGILFPPILFVNGVEFAGPVAELTWRLVAGPVFELGVALNGILPLDNDLGFGARVPLRLHRGDLLRLDVAPEVTVSAGDGRTYASGALPVTLLVHLAPPLTASLRTGVSTLGFDNAALFAGAELVYTVAGDHGAIADLSAGFAFPTLVDGSGRGTFLEAGHWSLTVGARFFVNLPADRMGQP